jgi:hypothetical protein
MKKMEVVNIVSLDRSSVTAFEFKPGSPQPFAA